MIVTGSVIEPDALRQSLFDPCAGAFVSFEGWVRNRNEGRDVVRLEYEAYEPLAVSEGEAVVKEAVSGFGLLRAYCIHRTGLLELGECAVWVGVSSGHRDEAFNACRFIIDEVKVRLPVWKKEFYTDGDSGWVNCDKCASHGLQHVEGY